ncbi:MAG: hypothetical protein IT315_06865 [Anaerolineales bacterium]|nr:hypothetical protein [Anaerolineales bacterium]
MPRTSPDIEIEEINGEKYPTLEAAQDSARVMLARDLAETIRTLIQRDALEVNDGRIIPKAN